MKRKIKGIEFQLNNKISSKISSEDMANEIFINNGLRREGDFYEGLVVGLEIGRLDERAKNEEIIQKNYIEFTEWCFDNGWRRLSNGNSWRSTKEIVSSTKELYNYWQNSIK